MSTVRVYWNLHKKVWSVKCGNQPVQHMTSLVLTNATFKVWEGGRQRTIAKRAKTVHAFACGKVDLTPQGDTSYASLIQVSYNPYKAGHFYRKDTGEAIYGAPRLVLTKEGRVFAHISTCSAAA